MAYIYKIENIDTGCVYIGSTINDPYKRMYHHKWELSNNFHSNNYIQNAWNKYGEDSFVFSVVLECEDTEYGYHDSIGAVISWNEYYEQELIDKYGGINSNSTYNLKQASNNGRYSEEAKKNISRGRTGVLSGEDHPWWGRNHTEESKKKMADSRRGKALTLEVKEKLSLATGGENNSQARITEDIVVEIREMYASGEYTYRDIAAIMGVSYTQTARIIKGESWKRVGGPILSVEEAAVIEKKNLCKRFPGERCSINKLTTKDVLELRNMYDLGEYTQKQLSEKFDIHLSTVWRILHRKTWKHV